jgi:hypothetical protein
MYRRSQWIELIEEALDQEVDHWGRTERIKLLRQVASTLLSECLHCRTAPSSVLVVEIG